MKENTDFGPFFVRIGLGLLFIFPGIMKLMNPGMIIGMLGGMGFPLPMVLGWLVIIAEVLGGIALLAGYKVNYVVWPLVVILVVATVAVYLPDLAKNATQVLFHLLGILSLISLYYSGPRAFSSEKSK